MPIRTQVDFPSWWSCRSKGAGENCRWKGSQTERSEVYPPLKLTVRPWKLMVGSWKITFLLGYLFSGAMLYSFREGILAVFFFSKRFCNATFAWFNTNIFFFCGVVFVNFPDFKERLFISLKKILGIILGMFFLVEQLYQLVVLVVFQMDGIKNNWMFFILFLVLLTWISRCSKLSSSWL